MKRYRSFETWFLDVAEALKEYLDDMGVYCEVLGVGRGYHFEVLLDDEEVKIVNRWLDNNIGICANKTA